MYRMKIGGAALLLAAAMPILPLHAQASQQVADHKDAAGPAVISPAHSDKARDHAAILAMAGTFRVTFDMRETMPIVAGYTALPPKMSRGQEVVRVILNTPDRVILQHFLVVSPKGGGTMVIKHWRQDWEWQPRTVLAYAGAGRWAVRPVTAEERRGAWSQTVWQTDDSPRYGGVGRWRHDTGSSRWTSEETLRPLARRDAVRVPPYDRYSGINRHVLAANGWLHEQENAKIGDRNGQPVTVVREQVVNSYVAARDYDVAAADAYWAATGDYWGQVRALWDAAIRKHRGLHLAEVAETGSATAEALMTFADAIAAGDMETGAAATQARDVIGKATAR